jgi:hypothetical protein
MSSAQEDTAQPAGDTETEAPQIHYLATIMYVYEIDATTPEEAEDQARSLFADDLGSLSPRDFGCDVEPAPLD